MSDTPAPIPYTATGKSNARIVMYLMIVASLGIVVFFNYYLKLKRDAEENRLPRPGKVQKDDSFLDQTGAVRSLLGLRGKIWVVSQVYTTCPSKCAGMAEEMAKLVAEFRNDPRVQFVSWAIYPEHDRPEILRAWTDARKASWPGFSDEKWWFLTARDATEQSGNVLRQLGRDNFKFTAEKNSAEHIAKNPADVWTHQFQMVLVDGRGDVRGYYYPFHEAFEGRWFPRHINVDIPKLLKEMEESAAQPP